ncbi:hypothetical protein CDL12_19117 [Handroanthus impetiginosus]|uniref:Uncharacterized protein n=1 Tax=Handroanthus impetiginosus TaxID=429701 RepID=A0A2G9GSM2_9LAMI|nr:hypothetical protein CDL12_19117 [Handroanthus impetiginosus]
MSLPPCCLLFPSPLIIFMLSPLSIIHAPFLSLSRTTSLFSLTSLFHPTFSLPSLFSPLPNENEKFSILKIYSNYSNKLMNARMIGSQ